MPTTITVEDSTLERFKNLKQELDREQADVPEHTADSFLNAIMDTWEHSKDDIAVSPAQEIAEELKDELVFAKESNAKVDPEAVIKRIDDLENQLPRKVKEELR